MRSQNFFNAGTNLVMDIPANESITLATGTLMDGVTYYLSFLGGTPTISVNGNPICIVDRHSPVIVPIIGTGQSINLVISNTLEGASYIGVPRLTIGKPSLYSMLPNIYKSVRKFGQKEIGEKVTTWLRSIEGVNSGRIQNNTNATVTMPNNVYTEITDISSTIVSTYLTQGAFVGVGRDGDGYYEIVGRIESGKFYLNNTAAFGKTLTLFRGYIFGCEWETL
jgi:hypothetical protein